MQSLTNCGRRTVFKCVTHTKNTIPTSLSLFLSLSLCIFGFCGLFALSFVIFYPIAPVYHSNPSLSLFQHRLVSFSVSNILQHLMPSSLPHYLLRLSLLLRVLSKDNRKVCFQTKYTVSSVSAGSLQAKKIIFLQFSSSS